jgi:site-specific DNA recombinase
MKKNAAIYARVSTRGHKQGETIESQIDAIQQYAIKEGYHIPDNFVFTDNKVSGKSLQRHSLDELRDVIRSESIDAIIAYSPDRLARNYSHQLILLEEFRKHGVKAHFLKDVSADKKDTPEGRLLTHMQGVIAEYERELIIDRSRRGRIYKAKRGDPAALPSLPFGYRRVKDGLKTTVELVEKQIVVVKEIFRLYNVESMSLSGIVEKLLQQGIKSPKGNLRWDPATIRDILKNPAYIGTAYYGKTERSEGISDKIRHYPSGKIIKAKCARKHVPQDNWIPIAIPPAIAESDLELAQEQLKANKIHACRNTKKPGLLQGLVICGECGYPFYKRFRKRKGKSTGSYYCRSHVDKRLKKCLNRSVNQEELDTLVYNEVMKLLQDPFLIQQELSRRAKDAANTEEVNREEINLKKELVKALEERDRLLDAFQTSLIDLKELSNRQKALDIRKTSLEDQLKAIQASRIEQEVGKGLQESLKAIMKDIQIISNELSDDKKQKLVRLLVEKVVVTTKEIKIIHCISPRVFLQGNSQLCLDGRI